MTEQKAKRPTTSSVVALVMARTAQQVAAERGDPEMLAEAKEYENRALAAINCICRSYRRGRSRRRFSCDSLAFNGSDQAALARVAGGPLHPGDPG